MFRVEASKPWCSNRSAALSRLMQAAEGRHSRLMHAAEGRQNTNTRTAGHCACKQILVTVVVCCPPHAMALQCHFSYPAQLAKFITQGLVVVFLECSAVRKALSTPGLWKKLLVVHFGLLIKCAYPLQVLQPPCKYHVSELC